jgi:hypothetical protein
MFNPECQDSSLYYQQPATSHGKTEKDNAWDKQNKGGKP